MGILHFCNDPLRTLYSTVGNGTSDRLVIVHLIRGGWDLFSFRTRLMETTQTPQGVETSPGSASHAACFTDRTYIHAERVERIPSTAVDDPLHTSSDDARTPRCFRSQKGGTPREGQRNVARSVRSAILYVRRRIDVNVGMTLLIFDLSNGISVGRIGSFAFIRRPADITLAVGRLLDAQGRTASGQEEYGVNISFSKCRTKSCTVGVHCSVSCAWRIRSTA